MVKWGRSAGEALQMGRKQKMDYSNSKGEEQSRTEEERDTFGTELGAVTQNWNRIPLVKAARNRRTSLLGIELEQTVKNTMKL